MGYKVRTVKTKRRGMLHAHPPPGGMFFPNFGQRGSTVGEEEMEAAGTLDIRSTLRPRRASLAERAYLLVREKILRRELPFGAILSRRRLGRELGMSFLPISEALKRLEHDGLVESRPRAGTRVRTPTEEDITGLYVLREALESQAARLCAERASDLEWRELRKLAARLDIRFSARSSHNHDPEWLYKAHTLHLRFHERIAECCSCPVLQEAIEKNRVLIYNFLYDTAAGRETLPPRFHGDLVEAILTRDPEQADAAMRRHVRFGLQQVLSRLRPQMARKGWRHGRTKQGHPVNRGPERGKFPPGWSALWPASD